MVIKRMPCIANDTDLQTRVEARRIWSIRRNGSVLYLLPLRGMNERR